MPFPTALGQSEHETRSAGISIFQVVNHEANSALTISDWKKTFFLQKFPFKTLYR